jgi:hypothetical protein
VLINQRVIWSNNGTLTDISQEMNDLFSGTKVIDLVYNQDAIYIGSDLPFNHRYIAIGVANSVASVMSVSIWNGSSWTAAVDVIDQTSVAGASMGQSGIISWDVDRNETWGLEDTTEDITALSTLKIYNKYWLKLTWSATWTGTTRLDYMGHKFSNDSALAAQWPDLNRSAIKTAHTAGKTTWDDQHILAAEQIINWMRKNQNIKSASQILGWEMFGEAAVHKVAEMIYSSFGEQKEDERKLAYEKFEEAIKSVHLNPIDQNADGVLDEEEKFGSRTWSRV